MKILNRYSLNNWLSILLLLLLSSTGKSNEEDENINNPASDAEINLLNQLISQIKNDTNKSPNYETGLKVSKWNKNMGINPEELGNYIEGDIIFPNNVFPRKQTNTRWAKGIIPFTIVPNFNREQRRVIIDAMNDIQKYTCVRFKPKNNTDTDYIIIKAENTGCWSSLGKVGGIQDVNLQIPQCVSKKGIVLHELMHVIGFLHEQSRFERDNFISIQWKNIMKGKEVNFEKSAKASADSYGVSYDFGSILHYSANAFSSNGKPTIVPRMNSINLLGQREGLSTKDVQKVRRMYRCSSKNRI